MLSQLLSTAFMAAAVYGAPSPAKAPLSYGAVGLTPYAPVSTVCPSSPLVRPAKGISSQEASYVSARSKAAAGATQAFLKANGISGGKTPVLGFSSSGGGYRALLSTAGVVQAFDSRDSNASVAGLYQALTYQTGLSGGSWFLSSLASNNWPTVTYLKDNLWLDSFQYSFLVPANLSTASAEEYADISADIAAKQAAGFETSIVDAYGRLLSYQLLSGPDGGVQDTLSGLAELSNFTSQNVPYPIIVTTIDFPEQNQCYPSLTGPIFEFHPYEYGSWDKGVSAFALTPYMGSTLNKGKPVKGTLCTTNYDNIGYVFGTSSDVFNGFDGGACFVPPVDDTDIVGVLTSLGLGSGSQNASVDTLFGLYPNPFYQYPRSSMVNKLTTLTLADGGEADQNNPIWPVIQPARDVDVLIVNDNSADTTDNFPNGTEIYQTYLNAKLFHLPKMPTIPPVSTFVAEGLNKRATFFGCNQPSTTLIVYLPNVNYTFPSNEPTSKIMYSMAETNGMIANGVQIATQNGKADWTQCLACAIGLRTGAKLPSACTACFKEYCYSGK